VPAPAADAGRWAFACEQSMKSFFQSREVPAKWAVPFVIVVILLVAVGFGGLVFTDFMETRARDAVLSSLNDLSPNATVTINRQARPKEPKFAMARKLLTLSSLKTRNALMNTGCIDRVAIILTTRLASSSVALRRRFFATTRKLEASSQGAVVIQMVTPNKSLDRSHGQRVSHQA